MYLEDYKRLGIISSLEAVNIIENQWDGERNHWLRKYLNKYDLRGIVTFFFRMNELKFRLYQFRKALLFLEVSIVFLVVVIFVS